MNTLKRLAVIGLSWLSFSSTASAQWDWNVLVGASAGGASRSGQVETNMAYTHPALIPGFFNTSLKRDLGDSGFIWGLLGGVQAHCGPWTFGVEANVSWHDFEDPSHFAFTDSRGAQGWTGTAEYDRGTVFGLTARGGYQILDWLMGYIRLGAETSDDELTVNYFGNANYPFGITVSDSKRSLRFVGGAGVEVPLPVFDGLVARAEYNYHSNGSTVDATGLLVEVPTFNINPQFTASTKQDTHSGIVSIVWNFM